jgi:hypothetical protein
LTVGKCTTEIKYLYDLNLIKENQCQFKCIGKSISCLFLEFDQRDQIINSDDDGLESINRKGNLQPFVVCTCQQYALLFMLIKRMARVHPFLEAGIFLYTFSWLWLVVHVDIPLIRFQTNVLVRQNLGGPSNVVYSFVLGIKWKLKISRFRICVMPPWHPWAFCAIQDGIQDGHHFKQTPRTPPLLQPGGPGCSIHISLSVGVWDWRWE